MNTINQTTDKNAEYVAAAKKAASNIDANSLSSLIKDAMADTSKESNRQAAFIVALFQNEVTYSESACLLLIKSEGKDKTARTDKALCDMSDEFTLAVNQYARLSELKKGERKTADILAIADLNNRIRAVRKMFGLAIVAVYYLRKSKAKQVKTTNKGKGALVVLMPNPEFEGSDVNLIESAAHFTAKGQAMITAASGKKKPAGQTKNPTANMVNDASKALSAVLTSLAADGKRKPITDFADDTEKQLKATLHELFAMTFFDGDKFDEPSFKAWLAAEFKPAAKAKQEGKKAA